MKKRLMSILLTTTMMVSMLTGCGGSTEQISESAAQEDEVRKLEDTKEGSVENEDSNPITVSFWCNFTGSDGDVLREIVDNYNKSNSDGITVEIDIMDFDTLQAKLPTAVSTGTGPSFILAGIEFINQYKENGMLESIDDFWDATGVDKMNFYENVLDKSYVDGVLYGVPMQYNCQYLYYNKDIFEAAGLDPETPPTTFEELEQAAVACTDASKNQYGLGLPLDYGNYCQYLWGNGGDVINSEGTENYLNSPENIETLKWIQKMAIDEGVSPSGLTAADADTMFQSGQLAMYTSGPWNINGLNSLGVNYGITGIPAGGDGAYSAEGGCSWMLSKGADAATRAAVYKFMAYWLSDDVLKEWSNRNGFPVWSYSVLEDPEIQDNDILSAVSKASEIGRDWHLGLAVGSQIDSDVMKPMMEKILMGGDVKESVEAASETLDAVLAQ